MLGIDPWLTSTLRPQPVTSPIDRSEGLYRAAFGIVLCAVFYVVGMLVAMYTLLLPPEGRHMSPMEALFLSPFMRSLFIVVAAPMASMVMRSATEISQCSRDIILAEILPKDAALAVLGNVTRAELVGKKQAQDADLAGGSMDGSSRVTPIPSSVGERRETHQPVCMWSMSASGQLLLRRWAL